jgi:multimeric flavodoxin WrbA
VNNLVDSDLVLFFTSVRWGQTNSLYQKLIERLTWLENRHSTLGEDNILKNIKCGIIISGHNFNGMSVLENQRQVLRFYGFDVQNQLCWNYQFTDNFLDESNKSYKNSSVNFFNTIKKYLDHKKNKEIL